MTDPPPAWTFVSHQPLRDALAAYAEKTGDNELYSYTYSPSGTETRVRFRDHTALGYARAVAYVQGLLLRA